MDHVSAASDIALSVTDVSKAYFIYERPQDRLKQMLWRGRRKFHAEFWALRDITFEVQKGETVGIVGPNGSGKSTLLQVICGTVTPTTGTVARNGRVSALLELGSGFNPEFTGRENVYLNATILGLTKAEVDERFESIERFADIGQFIDSPVKHYSSGMFARLAFSVAVHVDPEILIVDEILAVGDAAFQRRCLSKFYDIRRSGCTILFVSHDQYQVKSVCQRAIYLEKGRQKLFGSAGRVIDTYMVDMEAAEAARRSNEVGRAVAPVIHAAKSGGELRSDADGSRQSHETGSAPSPVAIATGALSEPMPASPDSQTPTFQFPYRIDSVRLFAYDGSERQHISTGDDLMLEMTFRALSDPPAGPISFVFNLYRHDDLYICGTTTLMDGIAPQPGFQSGRVKIRFPSLPLLSGRYKWRVAINDHGGFSVLAEAKDVCPFTVIDNFNAVGIVDLRREWSVEVMECGMASHNH